MPNHHDELLDMIGSLTCCSGAHELALRAIVELHTPIYDNSCFDLDCCGGPYHDLCDGCEDDYPCATIQAIEKELK
jgi:hypothetical protein